MPAVLKTPVRRVVAECVRVWHIGFDKSLINNLTDMVHSQLYLVTAISVRMCEHRGGKRVTTRDIVAACDIITGRWYIILIESCFHVYICLNLF